MPPQRDPRDHVLRLLGGLLGILLVLVLAVSWSHMIASTPSYGSAGRAERSEPYVDAEWKGTRDSSIGSIYVTGIVHNPTDRDWSFLQVKAPVFDRDGNILGHAYDNLAGLPAGRSWKFRAIGLGMTGAHKIGAPDLFGR